MTATGIIGRELSRDEYDNSCDYNMITHVTTICVFLLFCSFALCVCGFIFSKTHNLSPPPNTTPHYHPRTVFSFLKLTAQSRQLSGLASRKCLFDGV